MSRIKVLKVDQDDTLLLLFGIPAKLLIDISYFNPRERDRETGIQRGYDPKRSKEIAKYIDSEDAVLANNIIINFELRQLGLKFDDVYDSKDSTLDLDKMLRKAKSREGTTLKGKVAFVIDGQHRLRAFDYARKKDFPLIVTALIDLSLAEIAEIFVKINYYQKPVNKSLALDLLGITKDIFPQYYYFHDLVERLNDDIESPFYNNIRMLGVGKGFISQASIISAIEKYKLDRILKECNIPIDDGKTLYNIFWNYFRAVSKVFNEHWGENRFLSKTIGIRALIRLLGYILKHFWKEQIEFSEKNISKQLRQIDTGLFDSPELKGLGGEKGVRVLYKMLEEKIRF